MKNTEKTSDLATRRDYTTWWWMIGVGFLVAITVVLAVILNFSFNTSSNVVSDVIDIDNGDNKINWDNYETYDVKLSGNYNITAPGTYHLTGTIEDGGITVKLTDNGVTRLILDNVSITNSTGPAIACYSGEDLVVELIGENYLEDGASYNSTYDEDVKGAIYSKADLTFKGDGELILVANHEDGIVSKDDLKFSGGTYIISSKDDGIRGKDSVYIADGDFTITASGDGIKSTNTERSDKGFVLIAGGKIKIDRSTEGIEARKIIIDDGEISIFANDDGMNAAGDSTNSRNPMEADEACAIIVNGGKLYVNAAGDGIDSNGYLYFNGGETIVDGPTNSGNGALDAGAEIVMNGGTVMAVGASGMAESLGYNSTVYNISVFFTSTLAKGTEIEIKDPEGKTILSHTSTKTFSHLAAGSTDFQSGETYTVYVDGDKYSEFTISDIVTVIGSGGYGMPNGTGQLTRPGGENGQPAQTEQRGPGR